MSSYGPPGVKSTHPSLPARPPPSSGVATASPIYGSSSATSVSATPTTGYGPSVPPASQQSAQTPLGYSHSYVSVGGASRGTSGYDASTNYGGYGNYSGYSNDTYGSYASYQQTQQPPQQTAGYGPQAYGPQKPSAPPTATASTVSANMYGPQYGPTTGVAASAPPQIRNPFPAQSASSGSGAGSGNGYGYATGWQSGYGAQSGTSGGSSSSAHYGVGTGTATTYGPSVPSATSSASAGASTGTGPGALGGDVHSSFNNYNSYNSSQKQQQDRSKTVYRSGGGKTWVDDTLLEWDPSHLRLFVGNLAGEVTDDTLLKAFSRWPSVQKAVVKRDKWTKKSRGYGFVSFSDADDFFQAAKEMNGKYIGSHPVVVRKSKTDIKVSTFKDETKKGKKGHGGSRHVQDVEGGGKKKQSSGSGADGKRDPYEPALGPVSSGVHKQPKTKNGLKLLG